MEPNPNIAANVAAEVRASIARAGTNQKAVAEHIGMSQATLSRRLTGEDPTPFSVKELTDIARHLGITGHELLRAAEAAA